MTYAAIQACFSDFKIIRGRKIAMLCFEVPIEKADEALRALGGVPQIQTEVWCALARLDMKKASEPEKTRRKFVDLPLVQQIALICGQTGFWTFIRKSSEQEAAEYVREWCGVKSRAEIIEGSQEHEKWRKLSDRYQTWQQGHPF